MNIESQVDLPESNFTVGRSGNPVGLFVDHWMGARAGAGDLFASALARFRDPASRVSAHFLVGTTGRIVQIVNTDDTAYHAGNYDVNERSIGIEHEAGPLLPPSDALYAASAWLHRELSRIYRLPLEVGTTVKPHDAIVPTACPGTLDIAHIVALANLKEEDMDQDQFNRWFDARLAESPEYVNDIAAIKGALAKVAGDLKDTEYKAVVEALLDVKPEDLKPTPTGQP